MKTLKQPCLELVVFLVVFFLNKNSLDVTLATQQKNAPLSKISSQWISLMVREGTRTSICRWARLDVINASVPRGVSGFHNNLKQPRIVFKECYSPERPPLPWQYIHNPATTRRCPLVSARRRRFHAPGSQSSASDKLQQKSSPGACWRTGLHWNGPDRLWTRRLSELKHSSPTTSQLFVASIIVHILASLTLSNATLGTVYDVIMVALLKRPVGRW